MGLSPAVLLRRHRTGQAPFHLQRRLRRLLPPAGSQRCDGGAAEGAGHGSQGSYGRPSRDAPQLANKGEEERPSAEQNLNCATAGGRIVRPRRIIPPRSRSRRGAWPRRRSRISRSSASLRSSTKPEGRIFAVSGGGLPSFSKSNQIEPIAPTPDLRLGLEVAREFRTTGLVGGSLLRMALNGVEHDEDKTED